MPRFMTIVKRSEAYPPPPPPLYQAIERLMKEAGHRLIGVGGLLDSSKAATARLADGTVRFTDGPFSETKEVIGGYAIYDVASLAEAKEWTRRFLDLHITHYPGWSCEVEIRQMMDAPPATSRPVGQGLTR